VNREAVGRTGVSHDATSRGAKEAAGASAGGEEGGDGPGAKSLCSPRIGWLIMNTWNIRWIVYTWKTKHIGAWPRRFWPVPLWVCGFIWNWWWNWLYLYAMLDILGSSEFMSRNPPFTNHCFVDFPRSFWHCSCLNNVTQILRFIINFHTVPVVPHKAVAEVSKIGHFRWGELLWCMDGRANPQMDRKLVGAVFFGVVAVVTSTTTAGCSVV
jgi:hypothetical protein